MSSSDTDLNDQQQQTVTNLSEVAEQVVRGLKALDNLAQVAMRDRHAQLEAQRQVGLVADYLTRLVLRYDDGDFNKATYELAENLRELAKQANLQHASPEEIKAEMSEEEANRRLSLTVPVSMLERIEIPEDSDVDQARRRVIVASLEQLDSALPLAAAATNCFDPERWHITNLGNNVPIMALTSNVREIRPGVLVLVLARGQLVAETARLIEDLKRTFVGLKVVVAGPPFAKQANLGERLGADLYTSEIETVAELAEQALTPLSRLSEPLALSLDDAPVEGLREETPPAEPSEETEEEASPIDEVPTVKGVEENGSAA